MARWERYHFYPKEGVQWMKPAHNPTGLLVREIILLFKTKRYKNF